MKSTILRELKEQKGLWVSGESLSVKLGVTRTATWKHIKGLRDAGYNIESKANLGYRLLSVPDIPYPSEIAHGLLSQLIGSQVKYFAQVSSTNEEAKKMAHQGCPEGLVVVAETQTGGKGRIARLWFSPPQKGLWFSIVLRPQVALVDTPQLTMVMAVAVAEAVNKHTGAGAGIKWPNDLLVQDKKLCGILVELSAEMDRANFLVVGIGLNVNIDAEQFPAEIADIATSLKIATGKYILRTPLLQEILQAIDNWYLCWLKEGFIPVLDRWREMCVTLNCPVTVHGLKDSYDGYATDVDETGALLVETSDGSVKRLIAGEVSLRKKA